MKTEYIHRRRYGKRQIGREKVTCFYSKIIFTKGTIYSRMRTRVNATH